MTEIYSFNYGGQNLFVQFPVSAVLTKMAITRQRKHGSTIGKFCYKLDTYMNNIYKNKHDPTVKQTGKTLQSQA